MSSDRWMIMSHTIAYPIAHQTPFDAGPSSNCYTTHAKRRNVNVSSAVGRDIFKHHTPFQYALWNIQSSRSTLNGFWRCDRCAYKALNPREPSDVQGSMLSKLVWLIDLIQLGVQQSFSLILLLEFRYVKDTKREYLPARIKRAGFPLNTDRSWCTVLYYWSRYQIREHREPLARRITWLIQVIQALYH